MAFALCLLDLTADLCIYILEIIQEFHFVNKFWFILNTHPCLRLE